MKNLIVSLIACLISISVYAQPQANFTTNEFDNFTLHTYASYDAMADVSFIVEGENSLVVIEPQAFKGKVEEFMAYTENLGKPIDKVLVSFHAAGLNAYENEHKVITKPMAEFMKSDAAKGMLGFFDKAFKGAMDTKVVEFDEHIDASTEFIVDEVAYILEPTAVPGMPGVNIGIGSDVYYQHFAPAKGFHASKNQIKNKASIDGAFADAMKAKNGKYSLFIGSHGVGKGSTEDLKFQIKYLKTMQKAASKTTNTEEFIKQMNAKYPDCKGTEDLEAIAANIYK